LSIALSVTGRYGPDKQMPTVRFDTPHCGANVVAQPVADEPSPAPQPIPDESADEQLRLEAAQLAAYFRGRQKELDHREAELNSRMARLESEERAARLGTGQRQSDLPESQQDLERRLAAETLERQGQQLRRAMADLDERRRAVERRAEQVDQSRAALEPLRAEVARMHRETLEIRLATEELWARLAGAAPPPALVRSLGCIRAQLAQQYRRADAELAQRRQELEAIRGQLGAQHKKLAQCKLEFEQWAVGQHRSRHVPHVAAKGTRSAPAA
jgi:chromosome segregation ATPase